MGALRVEELKRLIEESSKFGLGAQLQEIQLTEKYLILQHYLKGSWCLGFELDSNSPAMGYFFGEPTKKKSLVKPLILFLKAHARNLRLHRIWLEEARGRVLFLEYGQGEALCTIECRLIPRGMNIIVQSGSKAISLFPVRDLPPSITDSTSMSSTPFQVDPYLDQWVNRYHGLGAGVTLTKAKVQPHLSPEEQHALKIKKEKEKKSALILKLQGDLENLNKPWFQVGEYIKEHQNLEMPEDWNKYINSQLPLSANIQNCFDKHKSQERSRDQVKERIFHLQKEVVELQRRLGEGDFQISTSGVRSLAGELLSKAKAKGRKKILAENIEALYGKSAKDNMAILRKAQSWDLWLHLRDFPGAHMIIRRPRGRSVDHSLVLEAARWLLEETVGKKKIIEGERYEVILTECRFVKPIKGDRLGRVRYQNESTLALRI